MIELKANPKANAYFYRLLKSGLLVLCLLLDQFLYLSNAFALTREERSAARDARRAECSELRGRERRDCRDRVREGRDESPTSATTSPPPQPTDEQLTNLCQSLESGMVGLQRQQLTINHSRSGKSYDQLTQEYNSLAAQYNLIQSMRDIRTNMLSVLGSLTSPSSSLTNIETLEGSPGEIELSAMGDFLAMEVTLKSLLGETEGNSLLTQLTAENADPQQLFRNMTASCDRLAATDAYFEDEEPAPINPDSVSPDNNFCTYIHGTAKTAPERQRAYRIFNKFFDTYRLAHQVESGTATDPRVRERQKAELNDLYQELTRGLNGTSIRDVFGVYGNYEQLTARTRDGLASYQECMNQLPTTESADPTAYRTALTRCESCWTTDLALCNPPSTVASSDSTATPLSSTLQRYASEFKTASSNLVEASPLLRRAILLNNADSTLGTGDITPYLDRLERSINNRVESAQVGINARARLLSRRGDLSGPTTELSPEILNGLRDRIVQTTNRRVFAEGIARRKNAAELERELLPANLPPQEVFRNFLLQLLDESLKAGSLLPSGMSSCFRDYTPRMNKDTLQTAAPDTLADLLDKCLESIAGTSDGALETNKESIAQRMEETKTALEQLRSQSDFNRFADYISVLQGLHRHRCNTEANPALTRNSCTLASLGLEPARADRNLETFTNAAGEILAEINDRLSGNREENLGRDLAVMCTHSTLQASLAAVCPLRNLVAGGSYVPPPEISSRDREVARANRDSMDGFHIDNDPVAGMVASGERRESFWEMGAVALAGGVGSVATTYAGVMAYNNTLPMQIASAQQFKLQQATYAAFQQRYPFGFPPGFFPMGGPFFNGFNTGFYIPPTFGLAGSASYSAYLSVR